MRRQTIFWTTLPNGVAGSDLRLSVHVAPRLETDEGETLVPFFPDFAGWPGVVAAMTFDVDFPGLGLTLPATRTSADPDTLRWGALFPPSTFVRPNRFAEFGFDHTLVLSYPVHHVVGFLKEQWGKFGVEWPVEYPTWEALAADDAFGPIGFSNKGDLTENGPARKRRLLDALAQRLDATSDDPNDWAIPYHPGPLAAADAVAEPFLQLERFLKPRGAKLLPAVTKPRPDFHDMLALALEHPTLLRLLGLVIDLTVDNPATQDLLAAQVRVVPHWLHALNDAPGDSLSHDIAPLTRCHLGPGRFEIAPRHPALTDLKNRHLRLGDENRFEVIVVDPDGGALKAMMLADNLQRSRTYSSASTAKKRTLTTPDTYSLPSLRSGGFSVARLGRATQFAFQMNAATALNKAAFDSQGLPALPPPEVSAEDVTRGYRWDVLDSLSNQWHTLMARRGQFRFLNLNGDAGEEPFEDEATTIAAPTKAADGSAPDLHLQESLLRWDGWSLAVPRPGRAITPTEDVEYKENTAETDFAFEIHPRAVPDTRRLPRLRLGQTYRFRARAVDLAGNSVPFEQGAQADDAELVTRAQVFARFEPVPQPPVLLRTRRTEAESPELVVIRSEDKDTPAAAITPSDRHILPPRMSQLMAEWHGLFDDETVPGRPLRQAAYQQIKDRDAATLQNHPDAQPEPDQPDSYVYDVNLMTLTYMPDVLARGASVRGLPDNPTSEALIPFDLGSAAPWPGYRPFRLAVVAGTSSGWGFFENNLNRILTVNLSKGDVFTLNLSCYLHEADLKLLAIWSWMLEHLGNNAATEAELAKLAEAGKLSMLTPGRELTLVHAVRTPLAPPELIDLAVTKEAGDTFAVLSQLVSVSRKSTSKVDVIGTWRMPIDTGAGGPDPTVLHDFEAVAFSLPVGTREGPDHLTFHERHEFGDTRYRRVRYQATATSCFTEYFREHSYGLAIDLADIPVVIAKDAQGNPIHIEAATVEVRDGTTGKAYQRERDYTVDGPAGTVAASSGGELPPGASVNVDFVRPDIHATGASVERIVRNSARPAAPKVLYVVPTFRWGRRTAMSSQRSGGGLRVYLERPWWSSGDEEQLGVVLWRPDFGELDPSDRLRPFVTMWGIDPVYQSTDLPGRPTMSAFPHRDPEVAGPVSLAETPGVLVDVAAHKVGFDKERDLWFCDLQINYGHSYQPFIRLALARYQHWSMAGAHLSPVILADFIQLAPDRHASVVPLTLDPPQPHLKAYQVTLSGPSYVSTKATN